MDMGMGHIAATRAMEMAMEKARSFGVGAVSVIPITTVPWAGPTWP